VKGLAIFANTNFRETAANSATSKLARRVNRFHATGCWNDTPPLPFQAVAWGE